ncbi:TIGR01244 family sulfur transferase [Sulfitobacter profundi]|uniref:TIGR01244 family sulfur transferase n=1 Tax=Sulfitobacter profundi TaxID=2679961 RepID=A0ABW1Z1I6_9RHOB
MENLRAQGITRILCNRPDAEVPPSHQAAAMREAAEAAGIAFAEQPLTHQTMTPDVIANNRALGVETDDTVLAYCASGTRSTIAWALGQAGEMDSDAIIEAARQGAMTLRTCARCWARATAKTAYRPRPRGRLLGRCPLQAVSGRSAAIAPGTPCRAHSPKS